MKAQPEEYHSYAAWPWQAGMIDRYLFCDSGFNQRVRTLKINIFTKDFSSLSLEKIKQEVHVNDILGFKR